jgi:hypothetical protein
MICFGMRSQLEENIQKQQDALESLLEESGKLVSANDALAAQPSGKL